MRSVSTLLTITIGWQSLGILLVLSGCSGDHKPIVPVRGTITFSDGQPLPAGTTLRFEPAEGRTGTATATVEVDGSFQAVHVSGRSGMEVGKYLIQVIPPREAEKDFYKHTPKEVAEGTLTAEIRDGMSPLQLTLPKAGKSR
ncbi:MAG: hypothetical protein RMJ88_05445 [Thermogemmata sp.]|nr:hypothetical protein [Thermogemmata sp.]